MYLEQVLGSHVQGTRLRDPAAWEGAPLPPPSRQVFSPHRMAARPGTVSRGDHRTGTSTTVGTSDSHSATSQSQPRKPEKTNFQP